MYRCNIITGEATPQAHLSGDIHSAGSIVFYVLTGGAHAFGKNPLDQQVNIRQGRPDLRRLQRQDQPWAVESFRAHNRSYDCT